MKYIKIRNNFLHVKEAIRHELLPPQVERAKEVWGETLLDLEKAEPTDAIQQGKWPLSEEDAQVVVNKMFNTDIEVLHDVLSTYNFKKYYEFLKLAFNPSKLDKKLTESFLNFNPEEFSYHSVISFQQNCFRLPNIKETIEDDVILKDENGRPIKGEDGKIQKVKKSEEDKGKVIFTNNTTDAFTLMSNYNDYIEKSNQDKNLKLEPSNYRRQSFSNLLSLYGDGIKGNFDLYPTRGVYLYITHKSSDILNISVSKFYTSCQELYEGGGHGEDYMKGLIYNLFDPNSMPAFLILDEPYYDESGKKLVEFMPLCRRMIRAVSGSNRRGNGHSDFKGLFFDATYPSRIGSVLEQMIEKYSTNRDTVNGDDYNYNFNLDLPEEFSLRRSPYLDNIGEGSQERIIGLNTKKLVITPNGKYKFGKSNNVEEVLIQTPEFDENILSKLTKLKFIGFESMKLNEYKQVGNIVLPNIKISRCIMSDDFLEGLSKQDIKELWIQSSQFDVSKLSLFKNLEKLTLLYMPIILIKPILDSLVNLKELSYSSDIYRMNSEVINSLKDRGIKIKKVGK